MVKCVQKPKRVPGSFHACDSRARTLGWTGRGPAARGPSLTRNNASSNARTESAASERNAGVQLHR